MLAGKFRFFKITLPSPPSREGADFLISRAQFLELGFGLFEFGLDGLEV